MTIEQNKAIASEFFERVSTNDIAGALAKLTYDATWWIAGKAGSAPVVGSHSKDKIGRLFYRIASQMRTGLTMTIKGMVAEGDNVALEVESYGELKNGRIYNQEYHFLMVIREGKISTVREYLDTQHVNAVWFQQQ